MNRLALLSGWVLVFVGGCGGMSTQDGDRSGDGTDSHTHWLSQCSTDADCDGELQCLCGACSSRCETESACDEFGAGAMCVELSCAQPSDAERATSLCSRGCERNADCPVDASCNEGVCVAGDLIRAVDAGSEPAPNASGPEDYDPCAGKACGEDCQFCTPDAPACNETDEPKRCNLEGRCDDSFDPTECMGAAPDLPDDCYGLDEAACSANTSCSPGYGSPVDTTAMCQEPYRFATCRPANHSCDDSLIAATDGSGACWTFSSICYDEGFDYSPSDPACRLDLEECGASSTAPSGCEAVDVRGTDGPECTPRYVWNGTSCESYSHCDCEGECEQLFLSQQTCETVWAGCSGVSACEPGRLPDQSVAGFDVAPTESADAVELSDWVPVTWGTPFSLPITFSCDENYVDFCGEPRDLNLIAGSGVSLPSVMLTLPTTSWSILAIEEGQEVEVIANDVQFAIRDAASDDLLLLVGRGYQESDAEETPWYVPPIEVTGEAPFCASAFTDDPECEQTEVSRNLRFYGYAPADVDITLEPFTLEDRLVSTTTGSATYRFLNGKSSFRGPSEPRDECAAATRDYEFIVARVVE